MHANLAMEQQTYESVPRSYERNAMIDPVMLIKGAFVGAAGTVLLDIWALFLARVMNVPATNWAMVGRWLGHMPLGKFHHASISAAEPVKGELAIGWTAHYAIGVGYGVLLLAFWGTGWLAAPTLLPPLILSWGLLIAPYFLMMPGMGLGIAGAKTPKPAITRIKSAVSHSVFGFGMYLAAEALEPLWPTAG
jgi:hypothetical protein